MLIVSGYMAVKAANLYPENLVIRLVDSGIRHPEDPSQIEQRWRKS